MTSNCLIELTEQASSSPELHQYDGRSLKFGRVPAIGERIQIGDASLLVVMVIHQPNQPDLVDAILKVE